MGDEVRSRCGACGRILHGTEPGEQHFCPSTLRRRRTHEVRDDDAAVGDPAGREEGDA